MVSDASFGVRFSFAIVQLSFFICHSSPMSCWLSANHFLEKKSLSSQLFAARKAMSTDCEVKMKNDN
jgi:hypothetical protein